jgi:hypothetical protein
MNDEATRIVVAGLRRIADELAALDEPKPRCVRPAGREKWTKETFLAAITDEHARRVVAEVLDRTEDGGYMTYQKARDPHDARTGGYVYLHVDGGRQPALSVRIGPDSVLLYGEWSGWGHANRLQPGWAELAAFLGADQMGPQRGRDVRLIDVDALWPVARRTEAAVNQAVEVR